MSAVAIHLCLIATLLGTSALAIVLGRSSAATPVVYGMTLAASLIGLAASILWLVHSAAVTPSVLTLPLGLPWLGAHFRLDSLAAYFLLVINLGSAAASLYALGYGRHEAEPQRVLPFFALFLAGMNLVVVADDAFSFLVAWEFMSLASWALVMAHHREEENLRAGYVYILMASLGSLALLLAFGLLAGPDGNYAFDSIRAIRITPLRAGLVLGLATFGAGSKAGLVPLHVWLPLAHPAAPSHVSALMSGVMTKVAIYGFIRIVFDLLGPPAWWWCVPILAAGGGTAVLGILYALMEGDIKRVLAYSTIENIGVIFAGLGLALAFDANGRPTAGALALTAAFFHILNHAVFKSVLFFGAGAVLTATGERRLDRLGGLIHPMAVTSFAFLVACTAISALPPLNGFVSEWLLFQAILISTDLPHWGLKLLIPAVGALLALSAALAAACFVRLFGIVFLGRPRSPAAEHVHEVDRWSQSAMLGLVTLCVLGGILPGFVIDFMAPVVQSITGARMPEQASMEWLSIVPVAESRSSYNGLVVFIFIATSAALAAYGIHRFASRTVRRAPAWDCGYPDQNPATQYTAASFAQPIRRVFGSYVFRAREHVEMRPPGDLRPARFEIEQHDFAWELIYTPVTKLVLLAATRLNQFQYLTIRVYLSFVSFALVFLLLVLALWP
ncbi:MAG TPA: hydrogenase 4 subunit B [Methylocella sp.]|jgi:formate hydrogenlyase subunit 3/multisubunit Na+/H+ antiporter MnhD subunit